MNRKCYEVDCLTNSNPVDHAKQLENFLNNGWELITDGMVPTYNQFQELEKVWFATFKREITPDESYEQSLMGLDDELALENRVRLEAADLIAADDPNEREVIANQIVGNEQVSAMVLMCLAEAVRPVMPVHETADMILQ